MQNHFLNLPPKKLNMSLEYEGRVNPQTAKYTDAYLQSKVQTQDIMISNLIYIHRYPHAKHDAGLVDKKGAKTTHGNQRTKDMMITVYCVHPQLMPSQQLLGRHNICLFTVHWTRDTHPQAGAGLDSLRQQRFSLYRLIAYSLQENIITSSCCRK